MAIKIECNAIDCMYNDEKDCTYDGILVIDKEAMCDEWSEPE